MTTTNVCDAQPGDIFIDFAQTLTPALAQAAADDPVFDVKGMMQYTPYGDTDRPKFGSAAEAQVAHEHGMYYMENWEIESARALQGYDVGRSDGARNREALRQQGYPEMVSAPVSVDMNTLFGNKDEVSGFVRGHFETDGDEAENISYLDSDGGRLLESQGIELGLWLPGAFFWSPEVYAESRRLKALGISGLPYMLAMAAFCTEHVPQAVCIQFPSQAAYGTRVDFNIVLRPFKVWCADREILEPQPDPPIDVLPLPTKPIPTTEDNMATAHVTVEGRYAEFIGQGPLLSDGSVHLVEVRWTGPGPLTADNNPWAYDHISAADTVPQHYALGTFQRDLILVGHQPEEIEDALAPDGHWARGDFARIG